MIHPARLATRLAATLGACGLFAALLTAFALLFGSPASAQEMQDMPGMAHDRGAAAPACNATSAPCEQTFYSEMAAVNARMHEAMAVPPGTDVDQDFVRMMIPHHQGAVDMAVVLLKYGRDERLRRLAQGIIAAQGQEIAYLQTLLAAPTGAPATEGRAPEPPAADTSTKQQSR